jgi:hypothetical protein
VANTAVISFLSESAAMICSYMLSLLHRKGTFCQWHQQHSDVANVADAYSCVLSIRSQSSYMIMSLSSWALISWLLLRGRCTRKGGVKGAHVQPGMQLSLSPAAVRIMLLPVRVGYGMRVC